EVRADLDRQLRDKLRPVDDPTDIPPWNLPELADLLPAGQSLRPAAVLIGLLPGEQGPSVLLTRRHEAMTHHAGQIAFPGGRREPGDPGWLDTASREAEEEVGVPRAQVNPLGLLAPYATISGFTVTPVVAWLEGEFDRVAQDTEVAEIFEAPLSWLVDPQRRRWEKIHWRGRERGYWVIDYQQYRIWGATAAMLVDLARTLEQR
ncbi:MAG: CoA pyrophosphatase, partial [Xanthomonadales bacterium]|nr:CoA pyrophosphatase [Xanthomonadales bacterium]